MGFSRLDCQIEGLSPHVIGRRARVLFYNFDRMLSLPQAGRTHLRVPMMIEILTQLKAGKSESPVRAGGRPCGRTDGQAGYLLVVRFLNNVAIP